MNHETITPTYIAPDGTILIRQDSIEGAVKEYGLKLFSQAIRHFAAYARVDKGDPCPFCRRAMEESHTGRLHNMPTVPSRVELDT